MGVCRPWTEELLDTPQALMLIYGKVSYHVSTRRASLLSTPDAAPFGVCITDPITSTPKLIGVRRKKALV